MFSFYVERQGRSDIACSIHKGSNEAGQRKLAGSWLANYVYKHKAWLYKHFHSTAGLASGMMPVESPLSGRHTYVLMYIATYRHTLYFNPFPLSTLHSN